MIRKVFLGMLILFTVSLAYGQSTREVNTPKAPAPKYQATKKTKKGFLFFGKKKKNRLVSGQEEVAEFRKRIKKTTRKKYKEQVKYDKPQYTDPVYFGHKKPPKKRKNGKKKFCKTCGMSH